MKKVVLIGIVFLLCVVGFAERHKIKSMLVWGTGHCARDTSPCDSCSF
jgi:hypothetical protein